MVGRLAVRALSMSCPPKPKSRRRSLRGRLHPHRPRRRRPPPQSCATASARAIHCGMIRRKSHSALFRRRFRRRTTAAETAVCSAAVRNSQACTSMTCPALCLWGPGAVGRRAVAERSLPCPPKKEKDEEEERVDGTEAAQAPMRLRFAAPQLTALKLRFARGNQRFQNFWGGPRCDPKVVPEKSHLLFLRIDC